MREKIKAIQPQCGHNWREKQFRLYCAKQVLERLVEQRFLTVPQIAKDLQISEDLVRIWIRTKQLPAYRVGKEYRIKQEDYEEFLKKRRTTDG
jgi:excisionase family DNA binding protein